MSIPRRTAVGYLAHAGTNDETSRRARRALQLCAKVEGFELAQVYEPATVGPDTVADPLATLQALASSCDAKTVVTVGALDAPMVEVTRRAELRVITVTDLTHRHHRAEAAPQVRPEPGQGIGYLDIDLRNAQGFLVATLEVTLAPTTLTLSIIDWTVAVLDRATFRDWLQPDHVLTVDDVQWSRHGNHLRLRIDSSRPYDVPAITIERLKRRLWARD